MTDRTTEHDDALGQILANKTEHARRLARIRADRDLTAADRLAAITAEHKRAAQRHEALVAAYRAAEGAEAEGVQVEKPTDANDALRLLIADSRNGPARSRGMLDAMIATSPPPVPVELAR